MKAISILAILVVALITMSCAVAAIEQQQNTTALNKTIPDENAKKEQWMFVQTAHSGSFFPVPGNEGLYNVTLAGVSPTTIVFSDRPYRTVEQAPMQKFLDSLGFSAKNPPNAAIEVLGANESEDVVVVELLNPVYDEANQILQYTARILEHPNLSYSEFNNRSDKKLAATFGPAAVFIDGPKSCPSRNVCCYDSKEICAYLENVPMCWQWSQGGCMPCRDQIPNCEQQGGKSCNQDIDTFCDSSKRR